MQCFVKYHNLLLLLFSLLYQIYFSDSWKAAEIGHNMGFAITLHDITHDEAILHAHHTQRLHGAQHPGPCSPACRWTGYGAPYAWPRVQPLHATGHGARRSPRPTRSTMTGARSIMAASSGHNNGKTTDYYHASGCPSPTAAAWATIHQAATTSC